MRFVGFPKVRRRGAVDEVANRFFWEGRVAFDSEELGDAYKVGVIREWIVVLLAPLAGDATPKRQCPVASTRPKEWHAILFFDVAQQDGPIVLSPNRHSEPH